MALYKSLVKKISISPEKKTKQKEYLPKGQLPIVDQGQQLIGGYSDNADKQLTCNLPVIVFGDHTRAVKYVDFPFGAGADGIKVLEPTEGINPEFLYYATQYLVLRLEDKGYARHYQHIEKKELDVPALKEQKRIVARIEELFSELDNGVETLRKTKQQLAVYRQAVLKDAFSGNWQCHKADGLCDFITKGTTPQKNDQLKEGKIPFIKVYNLTFDTSLDFNIDPTYISEEIHKGFLARSIVYPGDVLLNIVGPPMGKVSIVPDTYKEWNINQAIARFRCKDGLYNKFLAYFLGFAPTVEKMKSQSKATAGQFNLTLEICRNIEIPLPAIEKQKEIVASIESRLSVCDSIEKTVDTALQQADAMRQSILKQAFEGRL